MGKVLRLIEVLLMNVFAMLWLDGLTYETSSCMVPDQLLISCSAAHLGVQKRLCSNL